MSEQQNTQQPVAAQCRFEGEQEWKPCTIAHHLHVQAHPSEWPHYETRALFAEQPAPPAPRDVLMAALIEVRQAQMKIVREGLQGGRWAEDIDDAVSHLDLSAIADRYASQVQPERIAPDVMDALVGNDGGRKPEPVNQQTLAALKRLLHKAYKQNWQDNYPSEVECAEAAIAAAEAAQTDHIVDSDKMVHAVPDVLEQLQLAETEVINAKAWSAGEQAKTHCKHALTAIAVARSLLYAAQKQEGV